MKRIVFTAFFVSLCSSGKAQNATARDTLLVSRAEAEAIFLKNNLRLLSEKLNIDQAEAQVIQAKLWPNPRLEVGEINLWSNAKSEQLPPISGNWGKTSEVTVGLEQLIYTARKRKKLMAMEKVGVEIAQEYFQDFLRILKVEFRNNLTHLQYVEEKQSVYKKQLASIQKLLNAYSNQARQGNISKGEFIRLKASELEFVKQLSDLQKENNQLQKELKTLMNLPPQSFLKISMHQFVPDVNKMENINLTALTADALENRPDVKASVLEEKYNNRKYKYELSQRTPDVTLLASYDRGGNIMNDFVGVGFALDLPFFSRNQGNIKASKIEIQKSQYMKEEKNNQAQNEVIQAYEDLVVAKKLYENIEASYEKDLDMLLESHQKNFALRNTSMLEYLDFVNAYLENKTIILDSKKELNEHFEELQFVIGKEL
ncbi:cobalt-zinc-cadmium efflux system outer membrane protein [Flavobacterium gossypii]|uniref:Cobalt-zinc-cadmium efflux system outer membrane protein n=1 Tax=Flavobacterium gossypii TaxID=1646119 RepID=A0ABR6DTX9_9FLAO|nr:TolC family protein [Flavobacterium gossypii]MBA9074899.1 cobalt-zinc-cadmium efflux system outer membrane protein [Flavobacterium gossypii]